jgi:hypothetical protein
MRHFRILIIGLFLTLVTAGGCNRSRDSIDNGSISESDINEVAVEVAVEGGGQFPEFLTGKWKADEGGWEFVFEPNGTISSAVIEYEVSNQVWRQRDI